MEINYSSYVIYPESFNTAKWNDQIDFKCLGCNSISSKRKRNIKIELNIRHQKYPDRVHGIFCSSICARIYNGICRPVKLMTCKNCKKQIVVMMVSYDRSKSKRFFCSKSCSAIYNNAHKTRGSTRSKLEIWIESQLLGLYPNLDIHFNRKDTINSELDIYIPSLKLAFELNGIYHYEPIHGSEILENIQNNDTRKFQACLERGIELCIIDTSSQQYFKETTSMKFLQIIQKVINQKKSAVTDIRADRAEVL